MIYIKMFEGFKDYIFELREICKNGKRDQYDGTGWYYYLPNKISVGDVDGYRGYCTQFHISSHEYGYDINFNIVYNEHAETNEYLPDRILWDYISVSTREISALTGTKIDYVDGKFSESVAEITFYDDVYERIYKESIKPETVKFNNNYNSVSRKYKKIRNTKIDSLEKKKIWSENQYYIDLTSYQGHDSSSWKEVQDWTQEDYLKDIEVQKRQSETMVRILKGI